jgi:gliding motility-associated lipoprotein GldD
MICFLLVQCKENYSPKPKGYFRTDFPEKKYIRFTSDCPYSFEYPMYGKVVKDIQPNAEPYWMNIEFSQFKAKIHLSYKKVSSNLNGYIEDSHTLAYKHAIKADGIDEVLLEDSIRHMFGILYEIKGNAASSVQFYLTDSVHHFLRGSLYFEAQPNKDSLAPSIGFFRQDILHLIETLQWKNQ